MHSFRIALFLFLLSCSLSLDAVKPVAVYLTWMNDPSSTMTVQWVSDRNQFDDTLLYQKDGETSWQTAKGTHSTMPENEPYLIHRVELKTLSPEATYHFKIVGEEIAYKFRTLSRNPQTPLRFIVGGDMYGGSPQLLITTHKQAAKQDPHFALVGGDIAYAYTGPKSSKLKKIQNQRWVEWLKLWSENMITPSGYLIPLVPAIGNHDTEGRFGQTPAQAVFFYSIFPFPGKEGRNVLDLGSFLSIIVLDSGHTHTIPEQTKWLSETLAQREKQMHKFALYHIPAYPSVRKYTAEKHAIIRKYWVPLFEQFQLTAAFEHHDHAYKRTPPILKGKADPSGVIYLGDGGYGVTKPRIPAQAKSRWYLENTASKRHFILVSLQGNQRLYTAIDTAGNIFDQYRQTAR